MPTYAIIRDSDASGNSSLGNRIAKRFPGASYAFGKGQWLVATDLDTLGLATDLKIQKGGIYTGTLILQVSDYYGLHNKKLWDWLREHSTVGQSEDES